MTRPPIRGAMEPRCPPPAFFVGSSAEVIDGKIYMITNNSYVYFYDPDLDSWSAGAVSPFSYGDFDTAVYNDATFGEIVMVLTSGDIWNLEMQVHAYQPSGNQWLIGTPGYSKDLVGARGRHNR